VTDAAAAADLAARSAVILTTAGPYLRYGLPLVSACADAGTDYADLSGETIFVRRSIDAAHQRAIATGARIVHSCGFDSVPSDLGVGLNAEQAQADGQGRLARTVLRVRSFRGGVSGGTVDSLRQQIVETRSDPELRALAANPRALTNDPDRRTGSGRGGGGSGGSGVSRDLRTGRWQAPFVMGGYNRQIVLRSVELLGTDPDDQLRYSEVMDTGTGPVGAARAGLLAAGSTALMAGMWFEPSQRLLDRVLPVPGAGPSERTRARGRFLCEVVSETTTGARYRTRVGAEADPGYGATAIMLGQAGLALGSDADADADLRGPGGVLTPMAALGAPYAERLRRQGFTIVTGQLG